jgi:two-component system response regulator VicR
MSVNKYVESRLKMYYIDYNFVIYIVCLLHTPPKRLFIMKILIAEDDSLILKTMELCLKKDGYEIICCMDGLSAMEKIEQHHPDLIIVDIMLPYFSGLEIVGKVKQNENATPIIVISAMGQQDVVEEALKLGADQYISKPFNIRSLTDHITRLTNMAVTA